MDFGRWPDAWQWLDTGTFRKHLPAHAEPGAWRPLYAEQQEFMAVGEYTLTPYPGGDYWLQHKDGEGMQVRKERMETLIKELWKEF